MTDSKKQLQGVRVKIDEIDAGILALLDERMKLAMQISAIKKQTGKDIFDPKREEELFARLKELNKDTVIDDEKLLEIWGKIIELSRETQAGV